MRGSSGRSVAGAGSGRVAEGGGRPSRGPRGGEWRGVTASSSASSSVAKLSSRRLQLRGAQRQLLHVERISIDTCDCLDVFVAARAMSTGRNCRQTGRHALFAENHPSRAFPAVYHHLLLAAVAMIT